MYTLVTFVLLLQTIYSLEEITSQYVQLVYQQDMPDNWTTDLQDILVQDHYQNIWKLGKAEWRPNDGLNSLNWNLNCQTPVLFVEDENVEAEVSLPISVAEQSLPCFLKLNLSNIPKARRGVFTSVKIAKNYIFGPYKGTYRTSTPEEPDHPGVDHSYAWAITVHNDENGKQIMYKVDAINENHSNWLRYVNAARYEEEQNLAVAIVQNEVYYITYKTIEPGSELLVWYGPEYGRLLSLTLKPNTTVEWSNFFAPPVSHVLCNTCPEKPKEEIYEENLNGEVDSKQSDNFDNKINDEL